MDNRGEEDLREIAQLLAEKKNRADFDALQEQIREEERREGRALGWAQRTQKERERMKDEQRHSLLTKRRWSEKEEGEWWGKLELLDKRLDEITTLVIEETTREELETLQAETIRLGNQRRHVYAQWKASAQGAIVDREGFESFAKERKRLFDSGEIDIEQEREEERAFAEQAKKFVKDMENANKK